MCFPYARVRMHALKGLACRVRVTLAAWARHSRRLRATLAAAPLLFALAFVRCMEKARLPSSYDVLQDGDLQSATGVTFAVIGSCHQRTQVDARQVPGAYPTCVSTPIGNIGILPDLDAGNEGFVSDVMTVRGHCVCVCVCVCACIICRHHMNVPPDA